jgi:MFS family permease
MRPRVGLWPRGGLWRHADFLKLWSAETVSQVGSQISALALPFVAIVTLDVSAFEVALLGVVEFAPFILVTLPAGVLVDRLPRRPILVVGDLGRAGLLATIPLAYAFDLLTMWQLYAVGFVFGVCTVFFDVAYQSYLPSLVERDQLVEGNSKLEISRSGAQIGGPGLGGAIIEILTAPVAILADAISFLVSGLFVLGIRKHEPRPEPAEPGEKGPGMKAELAEGLRYVFGHRLLRSIAASTATFNFFGNLMFAILLVYAVRELGMSAGLIGVIFTIGNIGFLAGAVGASRISDRIGVGPAIVASAALSVSNLLVPLAPQDAEGAIPFLVAAQVIGSFGVVVYNVNQVSLRQAITPERLQGRMNSVMRFIVWGVIPLGTLAGGAIASVFGLRTAIWVGTIGMSLAVLPLLFSPVRSLIRVPEPEEPVRGEGEALAGIGPPPSPTVDDARA